MPIKYHGSYAHRTDVGKIRKNNEDQATVTLNSNGEVLLAVCDGMGGANKGDTASKIAINIISEEFKKKKKYLFANGDKRWFTKVAKKANSEIYDRAEHDPSCRGMGTTLVASIISDHRVVTACIGDSRCYMLNDKNSIEQLTEDQTYVHFLVSTGKITDEEAMSHPDRHVLMNALGIYPSVSLTVKEYEYAGESILCCSDGLYNQVQVEEIANILSTDERCDQKVASLIAVANHNGGSDNIAVALWETISHD